MADRIIYFFLPDVNGGVASVINNLVIGYPNNNHINIKIVLYSDTRNKRQPAHLATSTQVEIKYFRYNSFDNPYYYLKLLSRFISSSEAILVATDSIELNMVNLMQMDKILIFIVLGDFEHYYLLSVQHQHIINRYIVISNDIFNKLCQLLPHRVQDIFLAYFPTPPVFKFREIDITVNKPLKIIFVGRIEFIKDPLMLPQIESILKQNQVEVEWTIVGNGPLEMELKSSFLAINGSRVRYMGTLDNEALHKLYWEHDVMLMTSRAEGLPVSVIEAMKSGVVPIVSDLQGGIRDIIIDQHNGFLCQTGDAKHFALTIKNVHIHRLLLSDMARNSISSAEIQFDLIGNSQKYFDLILSTVFQMGNKKFGKAFNIMDKKWLPSILVKNFRYLISNFK